MQLVHFIHGLDPGLEVLLRIVLNLLLQLGVFSLGIINFVLLYFNFGLEFVDYFFQGGYFSLVL